MKRIIRLTEGDLRKIVKRSANRVLREFGSDGPDFDEPYGTSNMFQNIGMNGQHADSASDIDDFNPDDMGIYDGKESYEDDGIDFDDEVLDFYDGEGDSGSDGYYNEYDDDNQPDMIVPESRRRMSRIIKESIRKVLREDEWPPYPPYDDSIEDGSGKNVHNFPAPSQDGVNVPEETARYYGFRPEYRVERDGTELWGKDIKPGSQGRGLLSALGIREWATWNYKGHVKIYVKPEHTEPDSWRNKVRRKIGDYEDTEYIDKGGAIFHNPKNGHFKRFNVQDL